LKKLNRFISGIAVFILSISLMASCSNNEVETKKNPPIETKEVSIIEGIHLNPDLSVDEKVNKLIELMTLEEKVGQMVQTDRSTVRPDDVKKYFLGSLFSGGGSSPGRNNLKDWIKMCEDFQKAAMSTRLGIPIIYGIDAVHGHNTVHGAVVFPHNIGLGATGNSELMAGIGRVTAAEMIATGVNWNFAPCVAISRDERWGRTYECYSENPELVTQLSVPYIKAMQDYGISACAKHYLADGATLWGTGDNGHDIDQGDARISEEELRKIHLPAYQEAVKAGVKTVMISFSSWNGVKNHENSYLINNVLKDELGFDGFVVSDYEAIKQLSGSSFYEQLVDSVNAGVDMFMEPSQWKTVISSLKEAAEKGDIKEERLNDAVSRILRVKFETGLFENPTGDRKLAVEQLGQEENREVARQAVRESLVLLKNKNNVLPLKKEAKVFVTGPAADDVGIQCGGWTISWQGGTDRESRYGKRWTTGTTILEGFKRIAEKSGGTVLTDPKEAVNADVAVVVIGEKPYSEYEGDDRSLDLYSGVALSGNREALEQVKELGIPVVVVLVSGRPRIVTDEIQSWDAFVAAWILGTEGDQVADVLYGDYNFKGKLPITWPASVDQIPVNYGDDNNKDILFPYGFGLETRGE
jgi:beta-glucosidase